MKENEHLEHRYEFTAFTYTHVMEKHIYIYIYLRESENKPLHLCSLDFQQGCQDYVVEREVFSTKPIKIIKSVLKERIWSIPQSKKQLIINLISNYER